MEKSLKIKLLAKETVLQLFKIAATIETMRTKVFL